MEMEHLYEFTLVAKLESFSKAAEELCISQSALSKHMMALERELGAPLLVRNSRSVSLSPAGARILPMAVQVYELQNKIRAAVQSAAGKPMLRLASIPVMAQYNIIGLLAKFQNLRSDGTLEIIECEQRELPAMLEQGKCELAFVRRTEQTDDRFEYVEFCRDYLVAVVHRTHPLADMEGVSLEQLAEEPLLFLDQRTGLYDLCGSLCRQAGFLPKVAYTGHRPENLVELCAQSMGIALLMKRHTDYANNPEVVCIDIEPRVESMICLMRRKDPKPTALAEDFWAFASEHAVL